MGNRAARAFFWTATAASTAVFLALTVDTLGTIPGRTRQGELTPSVVAGKRAWQGHDCNDCHTILGIGGYYAPDLTRVSGVRDDAWLRAFLSDPERVWPAPRRMPDQGLSPGEIGDLTAFFRWVGGIDTN